MLSLKKVDLMEGKNSAQKKQPLSKESSDILDKKGTEFWQFFGRTNEEKLSDRLSNTIKLGKEKLCERMETNYSNFLSKLLLQSLHRLQESEVLMYVRDCDSRLVRRTTIPWATQKYAAKTGKIVKVHIDKNFRLNESFKGRVVISNVDRSLWVDNDVVAKVEDVAKNLFEQRNIENEAKGTFKYMNR